MSLDVTMNDVIDAMGEYDGREFCSAMAIVEDMFHHEDRYTGVKALKMAVKLSAARTLIGIRAAYWKSQPNSAECRHKKNVLISMEHNLEENINCLKAIAKSDLKAAGIL